MESGTTAASRAHPFRRTLTRTLPVLIIILFLASLSYLILISRFSPTSGPSLAPQNPTGDGKILLARGFMLWYREFGRDTGKPPVIVLHGGPAQSSMILREPFRFLEADHRVIYYDRRGSGNSEAKPTLADYTVGQLVWELEAVRLLIAKSDTVILLAHEFGGALALWYALDYQGAVDRMILLSPLPPDGYRVRSLGELYSEFTDAIAAAGIPPTNPSDADTWQHRYESRIATDLLADKSKAPLLGSLGGRFATSRALAASLTAVNRDERRNFSSLGTKTLIVYGTRESRYTREEYQTELHATLMNSKLVKIAGAGHWTFLDQPVLVERAISAFLAEPKY
jgi:proline iminopeptidase